MDESEVRVNLIMLKPTKEAEECLEQILTTFSEGLCMTASNLAEQEGRDCVELMDVLRAAETVLRLGYAAYKDVESRFEDFKKNFEPWKNN